MALRPPKSFSVDPFAAAELCLAAGAQSGLITEGIRIEHLQLSINFGLFFLKLNVLVHSDTLF